jgi:hypothetical protein
VIVITVTEAELVRLIGSLKYKNFPGYDGISNKNLKLCGPSISKQ